MRMRAERDALVEREVNEAATMRARQTRTRFISSLSFLTQIMRGWRLREAAGAWEVPRNS